jgi:hypothetical protein
MEWADNALRIYFVKKDQKRTQSKYPRDIYANPIDWVVCPIFSLGVYLGRFNKVAKGNSCLFPGYNQFKRFSCNFKQKPRKDSYLNKVLHQTTLACTVEGRGLLLILMPVQEDLHKVQSVYVVGTSQWADSKTFISSMSKVETCLWEVPYVVYPALFAQFSSSLMLFCQFRGKGI